MKPKESKHTERKVSHNKLEALLTLDQLCEQLNTRRSWVYEQTRLKRIPHYKLGKYLRFDLSEVLDWARAGD